MAEPNATEEARTPASDDPYDLGDTNLYPELEVAPAGSTLAPKTPTSTEQPATPRNPDGTFAPKPPEPKHPEWLLEQARELGMDDEAAELSTATLHKAVHKRIKERYTRDVERRGERTIQEATTDRSAAGAPTSGEKEIAPLAPSFDFGADFADDVHPSLQPYLQKLAARIMGLEKTVNQQASELGTMTSALQRQANETRDAALDRVILRTCDPAKVGKGSMAAVQGTPLGRWRIRVAQTAAELAGPKATLDDVLAKMPAAAAELGIERPKAPPATPAPAPAAANGETNGTGGRITPEQWNDAGVPPATSREGSPELTGKEVATKNLERRMKAAESVEDQEILDGLL